jgi:hypothetical protein
MPGNWPGFFSHPGIVGWLAAAGLPGGHFGSHTAPSQYLDDIFTNLGVECIDDAGDEQLDGSTVPFYPAVGEVASIRMSTSTVMPRGK